MNYYQHILVQFYDNVFSSIQFVKITSLLSISFEIKLAMTVIGTTTPLIAGTTKIG